MIISNLNKIVEERGIKQIWLAEKSGVNKATLSNIVKGRHTPSIEIAIRIANALELDVKDIWILIPDEKLKEYSKDIDWENIKF